MCNSSNAACSSSASEYTASSLEVMLKMEETTYQCQDYFHQQETTHQSVSPLHSEAPTDVEWRTKMAHWCYDIIDFCHLSRETAAIAMNYLDRYLVTEPGRRALSSRKLFQLASMTCLYTAIKVFEAEAMDPHLVSRLSQGIYTEDQITSMEVEILNALEWRMNPPTTMSFIRHFLDLLPCSVLTPKAFEKAFEIARYQSELAVCNHKFVSVKDSTLALACVCNALDIVTCDDTAVLDILLSSISKSIRIDQNSWVLTQGEICRNGTLQNFRNSSVATQLKGTSATKINKYGSHHRSPRSILTETKHI